MKLQIKKVISSINAIKFSSENTQPWKQEREKAENDLRILTLQGFRSP